MAFYVCDEHKLAWDRPNAVSGHFHASHKEKIDAEQHMVEEVPEGYAFRTTPKHREDILKEEREERGRQENEREQPQRFSATDDPEADALSRVLQSIGVRSEQVTVIVNGFLNIPQFRKDPNALGHWLDTHINDRKLKNYIPLCLEAVFGQQQQATDSAASYYLYPQTQAAPNNSPFPQYNQHLPAPSFGYPPYNLPSPGGPTPFPWYPPPPPPAPKEGDTALEKEITTLNNKVERAFDELKEERLDRARERLEQERREKDKETDAHFEKLERLIAQVARNDKPQAAATEEILREEIRGMRSEISDQKYERLESAFINLANDVKNARPGDTTGRTTEDLFHEIGPLALEKIDRMGDGFTREIRDLREQALPRHEGEAAGADIPGSEPRTLEEIATLAEIENQILNLPNEEISEFETAPDYQPAEEPELVMAEDL